ncbi:MAG TPA: flagellar basal body rod protein FlgC [Hyphomicrobiaceae bacterium]|nr:flagellar basal body rod protein FlgC [Hyphomicrobiaceae bacterium]
MDPLNVTLKIAGSGLEAQSLRMRVVAENLANAESTGNTPGADPYQRQVVSFAEALDEASGASLVNIERISRDIAPFRVEHDPNHPAADENGFVKLPNVNTLIELADMREANRSYAANLQVIRQAREMISMTIDMLRHS